MSPSSSFLVVTLNFSIYYYHGFQDLGEERDGSPFFAECSSYLHALRGKDSSQLFIHVEFLAPIDGIIFDIVPSVEPIATYHPAQIAADRGTIRGATISA
jgi:hypothetical protein